MRIAPAKQLIQSASRQIIYLSVGATMTIFGLLFFWLLVSLIGEPLFLVAHLLSYAVTVCLSFFLQSKFTFQTKMSLLGFSHYVISTLASLGANTLMLIILVAGLGIRAVVAQILSYMVVIPIFYWLNQRLVFRR